MQAIHDMVERLTNALSIGEWLPCWALYCFMVEDLLSIVLALITLGHLIVNKCVGFMRTMKQCRC